MRWLLVNKSSTIDDLYINNRDTLVDKFEDDEFFEEIPESSVKKFKRFISNEKNIDTSKNIKKDVESMLYNYKDKAIDSKQKWLHNK
jgi:hypothetical protein